VSSRSFLASCGFFFFSFFFTSPCPLFNFSFLSLEVCGSITSNSDSNFSAPWKRATLLNTPAYVGSADFLSNLVWLKVGNQDDLMNAPVLPDETPSDKATCVIVGTVSPVRLFLEPHGNFNPAFDNSALESSKVQFQLVQPVTHPEFSDDFKLGIERIERLQTKAISEGPNPEHFVISDGRTKALKFSWPMFEKRVRPFFPHSWCC
jgi:hypothetical protein